MKVLISADMEGITGVTVPEDVHPGGPEWIRFRELMTGDVNAATAGFFQAGASEVIVNDAHWAARNMLLEKLDRRARLVTGRSKELGMMEGIQRGVDAVAFVGYHAGPGRCGILSHMFLPSAVTRVSINGQEASEGRMNTLLAAEFGVSLVLVTGDTAACADAAEYSPGALTVAVKETLDRYSAICMTPEATGEAIREAATRSLAKLPAVPPTVGPFSFEVDFLGSQSALAVTAIPGVERVSDCRVRFACGRMREAFRCFKAVTVVGDSATEPDYT